VKEAEPKGRVWKLRWHSVKSVKQRQYEGRRLVDEKEFTTKEDGDRAIDKPYGSDKKKDQD